MQHKCIHQLQWRHNDHDGVSNHQPHGCLFNHLFRRGSKKTPELRVTGLCVGNSPGPVNSPHKRPVARKMFPFDDVIMQSPLLGFASNYCMLVMTVVILWDQLNNPSGFRLRGDSLSRRNNLLQKINNKCIEYNPPYPDNWGSYYFCSKSYQ